MFLCMSGGSFAKALKSEALATLIVFIGPSRRGVDVRCFYWVMISCELVLQSLCLKLDYHIFLCHGQ